jgi:hypothetical protein
MDERDRKPWSFQSVQSVHFGLLGLAAAAVLFTLSQAHGAFGTSEEASAPPVCSAWHRGQGESHRIDLVKMKRSYEELKNRLSRSVAGSMRKEMEAVALKGYDSGLPACRSTEKRSFSPKSNIPPDFLGKRLWFARFESGKQPAIPDLVKDDPGAIVFATRVEKFEILAEVSKTLGRPVSLAPRELPQALGVRCAPAVVSISKNGEVEIHENP